MLWLAAGALFKLFEGSPNDVPESVRDLSPFGALNTMRVAIGVELAVVGAVIALPRIGWLFLAALYCVFIGALLPLALSGETSCGCFGGNITISPWLMLGIDASLLVAVLATKPWRALPKESGLGFVALLPILAVAAYAPYKKIQEADLPTIERRAPVAFSAPVIPNGTPVSPSRGTAPEASPNAASGVAGSPDLTSEVAPTPDVAETTTPANPAELVLPEYRELRITDWVGQDVWDTELTYFYEAGANAGFAQGAFMPNSHVIVYRQTCHVCKEHLEKVWEEVQNGAPQWQGRTLVLLRLAETKDTEENNDCQLLPEPSEKITFPALKRGYVLTTPYSFDIDENNLIQNPVDLRTK